MNTLNSPTIIDSNTLHVPVHDITENTKNPLNQEDPSTLYTKKSIDTQPLQTHQTIQQSYDPPSPHLKILLLKLHINKVHLTHFKPNNTLQQNHIFKPLLLQVNFRRPYKIFLLNLPSKSQNSNTVLTIITLHTNPITNATTSRTLSRPPLPLIQTNPLSYNLTITICHSQPSSDTTQYNTNLQSSSTLFKTHIPTTIIQTNSHLQPISIQPQTNTLNIPSTSFNSHTTHATLLTTLNTPTYIYSSASLSEPIKPFDGLDHTYTPEEYLQHIEARVTFSLGSQPTTAHEYKFWHALVQAFKNTFHHKRTLIMNKLKFLA